MNLPQFEKFIKNPFPGRLLTLDPGQTTGWARWENSELVDRGQWNTFPVNSCIDLIVRELSPVRVNAVVMEEYRVYAHKTEDHAQNDMHTSRLIGAIEFWCGLNDIPYRMQGAGIVKNWATDEKLKVWDMWIKGERHARDAIRHGIYFLHHGKPLTI